MKKLILVLAFIFVLFKTGDEHPLDTKIDMTVNNTMKSNFIPAYKRLRHFEGNYGHQPNDKGGETYAGIARNFNKHWCGWKHIDLNRKHLKQNYYIDNKVLEYWILDYYLDIWVSEQFYLIEDQDVANYLFDLRINSHHTGMKITQRTLSQMGQPVKITYSLDEQTIGALNIVNPDLFLNKLRNSRIIFYKKIVKRDSTQKEFYQNWVDRANILKSPI
jgi:lysozyme family protein